MKYLRTKSIVSCRFYRRTLNCGSNGMPSRADSLWKMPHAGWPEVLKEKERILKPCKQFRVFLPFFALEAGKIVLCRFEVAVAE